MGYSSHCIGQMYRWDVKESMFMVRNRYEMKRNSLLQGSKECSVFLHLIPITANHYANSVSKNILPFTSQWYKCVCAVCINVTSSAAKIPFWWSKLGSMKVLAGEKSKRCDKEKYSKCTTAIICEYVVTNMKWMKLLSHSHSFGFVPKHTRSLARTTFTLLDVNDFILDVVRCRLFCLLIFLHRVY